MSLKIRKTRVSDARDISDLVLSLKDIFLADPASEEVQAFLETLQPDATAERIVSAEFEYHVAENEHGICGVIAIREKSHVYHLFVRSDSHRQGIARALWEHARHHSGARSFTVNSSPYAVPAYERLGFRATGPQRSEHGLDFVPMVFESSDRVSQ